jgi:hypothetical protein
MEWVNCVSNTVKPILKVHIASPDLNKLRIRVQKV